MSQNLTIALIREVFFGEGAAERLMERLAEARTAGARLALLPELPVDPWVPCTRKPSDADAELPGGRRHQMLSDCARRTGVSFIGGAIVKDPVSGDRHNTALFYRNNGELSLSYGKVHLPEEPGFWETSHYRPSSNPPGIFPIGGFKLGLQICSDANRAQGTQWLAAHGAHAMLNPRATEAATYQRWRLAFRAAALMAGIYVLSTPRPRPEEGVLLGGCSVAVDPQGEVILETEDTVSVVTLSASEVLRARTGYPGYLDYPAAAYSEWWER